MWTWCKFKGRRHCDVCIATKLEGMYPSNLACAVVQHVIKWLVSGTRTEAIAHADRSLGLASMSCQSVSPIDGCVLFFLDDDNRAQRHCCFAPPILWIFSHGLKRIKIQKSYSFGDSFRLPLMLNSLSSSTLLSLSNRPQLAKKYQEWL